MRLNSDYINEWIGTPTDIIMGAVHRIPAKNPSFSTTNFAYLYPTVDSPTENVVLYLGQSSEPKMGTNISFNTTINYYDRFMLLNLDYTISDTGKSIYDYVKEEGEKYFPLYAKVLEVGRIYKPHYIPFTIDEFINHNSSIYRMSYKYNDDGSRTEIFYKFETPPSDVEIKFKMREGLITMYEDLGTI